jgi:hypothetical protein
MVIIPLPIAILTISICGEAGNEAWGWSPHDMEEGKEQPCNGANRAELNKVVLNGTMFISTALLVMLCIVCKSHKNLWEKSIQLEQQGKLILIAHQHIPPKTDVIDGGVRHKWIRPTEDPRAATTHSHCGGESMVTSHFFFFFLNPLTCT